MQNAENETAAQGLASFDWASLDTVPLIVGGAVLFLFAFAWMRIFAKAGYHWAVGLLMVVPVVNVIMLFVLAFGSWPILREVGSLRKMEKSVENLGAQLPRRAA